MSTEPTILTDTRRVLADCGAGVRQPSTTELLELHARLRALANHPSVDEDLRARVHGAMLVTQVLLQAATERDGFGLAV